MSESLEASLPCRSQHRAEDEIAWIQAYNQFNGQLPAGCSTSDILTLKHWPNFTRLPHSPSCYRIAALLTVKSASVAKVSRTLEIPESEVSRFYSACKASGYLEQRHQQAEEFEIKTHRNQPLISSLLQKLKRF